MNAEDGGGREGSDPLSEAERWRMAWLEVRVRELEARPPEPGDPLRLLDGPQRQLSAEEVRRETERLLAVCAERGVGAVLADVCTCRELLESLAEACFQAGLTSAGQYLDYLRCPSAG